MAADNIVDLIVNQKASFEVTFTVKEGNSVLNLGGYTATAGLKTDFTAPDSQVISFTTTISDPTAGQVKIALSPVQTANLKLQRYYYDLTITSGGGFKTRIVEGTIKVSGGVS